MILVTVEKYSWLSNGEAESQIQAYMKEEHTFEEYCEEIDKYRDLSKEIMILPSIEHYDMIRLDCEDLKRGLSDVAKAHADTLLNKVATDHREENKRWVSLRVISLSDRTWYKLMQVQENISITRSTLFAHILDD